MSRHLVTLHARDRAGSAVSGVRWQFYAYEESPAWLTFDGGTYTVSAGSLPTAEAIYSSPSEQSSAAIAELLSGADGTPADLAYLPAGRYVAIGSIGTGAGTRYWVVRDYILGAREDSNAIDAQGEEFNSAAYIAIVDAALAEITSPHIGKRVDVTNYVDADAAPLHSSTYVYRGIGASGADWIRDDDSVIIAALETEIGALEDRIADLEAASAALSAEIENA